MAKAIMIQGTCSGAGKSLLTAAFCRIFRQDGYSVAPFKSQNMALNSFITCEGLEMGRAQVMQAQAAGIEPSVLMNPILLKPSSDTGSQVIVNGEVLGNMSAREYFAQKRAQIPHIKKAYNTLAEKYDVIVIEGAGSPAEINLKSEDIVNMGMAKIAKAPVLLAGDIDRGGVFAALAGTMLLLEQEERAMVKGLLINKFRGDQTILTPGVRQIEQITGVPCLGVIPWMPLDIDDEDSLSDRLTKSGNPAQIDIAVIRSPRISNFTDFNPLGAVEGVSLRYLLDVNKLGAPDLLILPGSKNTMEDLVWMRQNGLEAAIKKYAAAGGIVLGICGGYQMLGKELYDPHGVEHGGRMAGMGLLPIQTTFLPQKTRMQVEGRFCAVSGALAELSDMPLQGYEIHMGKTVAEDGTPLTAQMDPTTKETVLEGCQQGNVYGSYLHGFFDRSEVVQAVIASLCRRKGLDPETFAAIDLESYREEQFDRLADGVRQQIDLEKIYQILEAGIE